MYAGKPSSLTSISRHDQLGKRKYAGMNCGRSGWVLKGRLMPAGLTSPLGSQLRRVRNFIQKHIPSARHFVEGESKRISPNRYWKSPVIIYTGTNGRREYVVPDGWFRSAVGEALRDYFDSLVEYGFLNGDGFVTRDLVERFGRVLVASIKPRILKYRTRAEKQDDRELIAESVKSVRDYVKRHENDARD
jgi:hypothetical protein